MKSKTYLLFATVSVGVLIAVTARPSVGQVGKTNIILPGEMQPATNAAAPKPIPPIPGVSDVGNGQFEIKSQFRPLSVAAILLQRKLGIPISYEDADWQSPSDLRTGDLNISMPPSTTVLQIPGYISLMQAAIQSYSGFGNSGEFVVRQFGQGEFSIVSAVALTPANQARSYTSPLDTKISFSLANRSLAETVSLIYRSIREAGRGPVVGREPLSGQPQYAWEGPVLDGNHTGFYFQNIKVTVGANNETARNVLEKALRIPGEQKMSWSMLYAPTTQHYFVSLNTVQVETPDQAGGVQLTPLSWPRS